MGLLDNREDLQALLMNAGLGMLAARTRNPWQALGQGGLLGVAGMYDAKQSRRRDELAKAEDEYKRAQVQHMGLQNQQLLTQQARADRLNKAYEEAPKPMPPLGQVMGMTPQANAAVASAPRQNPTQAEYDRLMKMASYLDGKGFVDEAEKFYARAEKMREEYSLTPQTVMVDGKPTLVRYGKYGGSQTEQGSPKPEYTKVSTGQQDYWADPLTGNRSPIGTIQQIMSPEQVDSSKRGWAQFGLARNADARAAAAAAAGPKPPEGYRWTADGKTLEKIPGGPKDDSQQVETKKASALSRADVVLGTLDEAIGSVRGENWISPRTGLAGQIAGNVAGTEAYNLRRAAETIKANIGFQELQAMRDASPTGGALGQVAVQELNFLQAAIANLDANQENAVLLRNLEKVQRHYRRVKEIIGGVPYDNTPRSTGGKITQGGGWKIEKE